MTMTIKMVIQLDEEGRIIHSYSDAEYVAHFMFDETRAGMGGHHWVGEFVIEEGELQNKILALIKEHDEHGEVKRGPGADCWGYDPLTCIVGYDEHTNIEGYEEQVNTHGECWYGPSPKPVTHE
jgi:hypothetical protein